MWRLTSSSMALICDKASHVGRQLARAAAAAVGPWRRQRSILVDAAAGRPFLLIEPF